MDLTRFSINYISHVRTTFASVLYAACQLLILFHPRAHYVYTLVNLLYMRIYTHRIMYALPGFFHDMFPHLLIYPVSET